MTENQLKTVVGLIAGLQTAIVHLSNQVCVHAGITPDALAKTFEEHGESIPPEAHNRELLQLVLRRTAEGIRSPEAPIPDNVIYGLFD